MSEEIKAKKADPEVWMVFVKAQYVRDAQAFTGKKNFAADIYEDEDGWLDIGGPVLCAIYRDLTKEEVIKKNQNIYPDAPEEVFVYVSCENLGNNGYLDLF